MTARHQVSSVLAIYLENLTIQLRLLHVPGDRIGQILAEVETYVADTGLDPAAAFGEPGEYAATYAATYVAEAPMGHPVQGWLPGSAVKVAVPVALAGWAILEGGVHVGATRVDLDGMGPGSSLDNCVWARPDA
jgi:hypothetical protein